MSSLRRNCLDAAIIALITFLFAAAALPAFADTYQLNTVAYSHNETFYGIDDKGDYVVNLSATMGTGNSPCGSVAHASACFETFYAGQSAPVFSTTPPALNYDNGSACTPTLSDGADSNAGVCNNGHELFSSSNNTFPGLWTGTNPGTDYLTLGTFNQGFMNSNGDAVFVDSLTGTLLCVMDIPTTLPSLSAFADPSPAPVPEPGTLFMVGTGVVSLAGAIRRKFRQ